MRDDGALGFLIGLIGVLAILLIALICDVSEWVLPLG
jgi:hypothetical protein